MHCELPIRHISKQSCSPIIGELSSRSGCSHSDGRATFLFTMVEDPQENYITGWIKLYRSFIKWEWFGDSNMVHIFIYLLLSANRKDGSWRGVEVKKGQLVTGINTLSKDLNMSIQKIRTCLDRLEKSKEINRAFPNSKA